MRTELERLDRETTSLESEVTRLDGRVAAALRDRSVSDEDFLALCERTATVRRHLWTAWRRLRQVQEHEV